MTPSGMDKHRDVNLGRLDHGSAIVDINLSDIAKSVLSLQAKGFASQPVGRQSSRHPDGVPNHAWNARERIVGPGAVVVDRFAPIRQASQQLQIDLSLTMGPCQVLGYRNYFTV